MSSVYSAHKVGMVCGECGNIMTKKVRLVVSTAHTQSAAAELRRGRLFEVSCPVCHEFDLATFRNIYHDEYHHLLVLAEPPRGYNLEEGWALLDQMRRTGEYADLGLIPKWPKTKPSTPLCDHVFRLVTHPDAQAEKARIFWDGLDDRVIELLKAEMFRHYYREHDLMGTTTVIYSGYSPTRGLRFAIEATGHYAWVDPFVYKNIAKHFDPESLEQPSDFIVDIDWAYKVLAAG